MGTTRVTSAANRPECEKIAVSSNRFWRFTQSLSSATGTPRVERALRRSGTRTSRKRVARLRRELGLRTRYSRRYRVTTDSKHAKPLAPNRLQRDFTSSTPDRIWVGDITYLRAGGSWLYLAVLLDVYSRRVVGWSLSSRIDEDLVRQVLERALGVKAQHVRQVHPGSSEIMVLQQANDPEEIPNESPW